VNAQNAAHQQGYIARIFPERRIFIRSDDETRYIRLRPATQLIAWTGSFVVLSWTIIASAVLLMDNIGSGSIRDLAEREQALYETRLSEIAAERDHQIMLAADAQKRFSTALGQISRLQSELLASDARRREMETGMTAVQSSLRTAISDRDAAREKSAQLQADAKRSGADLRTDASHVADLEQTLDYLSGTMSAIADETAATRADAEAATAQADDLTRDVALMKERNARIFSRLEEAVNHSLVPLGKLFNSVKLPADKLLDQLKTTAEGNDAAMTPISFPAGDGTVDQDTVRANALLGRLEELALYTIAVEELPFGTPVESHVRFSSSFGYRTDPFTGQRKLHNGQDFAGAYGTTIYATADGVVFRAYRSSSYGNVVEIRHLDGFETRYAHMSRILVKPGQKVSRGDVIGAMGSTGRSTGTHLHYEVRRNGDPVNPMTYIKAAQDVF